MRDSEGLNKMILAKNNDDMIPLEYAMKNGSRDVIPLLITPATVKQVPKIAFPNLLCFCLTVSQKNCVSKILCFAFV
jgi:hypothetical protein